MWSYENTETYFGIILGLLVATGIYMTPQAISADWPKGLPFSPQQLAIIKQTKLALETYQVDGDKKGVIDDTKMYYGAMKGLVSWSGIPLPVFVEPRSSRKRTSRWRANTVGSVFIYLA